MRVIDLLNRSTRNLSIIVLDYDNNELITVYKRDKDNRDILREYYDCQVVEIMGMGCRKIWIHIHKGEEETEKEI